MSPIDTLPDFDWTEHARGEIAIYPDLVSQSTYAWKIGKIAVVGLIYSSWLSPPWLWFALAKGTTLRDLLDFRRMKDMIPHDTRVAVEAGFRQGHKFALAFGFEPIISTVGDRCYTIYRRV